ncbi:hemerythrin domain-containing protein [Streptomyces sp. DSM 44917]|uniref:Hemerythrin domain-containing protein n=1 Tax=Streptomyces boetiae TaxID=3075541 RepID=A0ABU2LDF9_9ACTN|nr:hemerythrin domain-containing protein [Streptomyces sp. DSM 44917]MDT0309525.1 hemerythrin domain-containing protein [Streptomyces sp. DSM 44917]
MTPTHNDADRAEEDVVALLKRQHEEIKHLFAQVEAASGDERRAAFDGLVRLLAVHETAEEEVVHPAAKKTVPNGDQVVAERLEEEREAKEVLSRLDGMNPDDPQFLPQLISLRDAVVAHAEAEEQFEFEALRTRTDPEKLARMARAVKAAEATAPTHPHPGVESRAKNMAFGPIAAVVDRTRDAVRQSMGGRDDRR